MGRFKIPEQMPGVSYPMYMRDKRRRGMINHWLKDEGKRYEFPLQVPVSRNMMKWIYDVRVIIAKNLMVSPHRITTGIVVEACMNHFLRDYRTIGTRKWEDILELQWRMTTDNKQRTMIQISYDQLRQIEEAMEWLEYEWDSHATMVKIIECALFYHLNEIDPRMPIGVENE